MFQPRDLTDPQFQDSVSDEQLLTSIQQGKNKMPAFALPEATAKKLVLLIRRLGEFGRQQRGFAPRRGGTASAKSDTNGTGGGGTGAQKPSRGGAAAVE